MISANNVTYRVGKKALFEDVNIKFTEGNCYGLIGANGEGKSTFMNIITGKLQPDEVSWTPPKVISSSPPVSVSPCWSRIISNTMTTWLWIPLSWVTNVSSRS